MSKVLKGNAGAQDRRRNARRRAYFAAACRLRCRGWVPRRPRDAPARRVRRSNCRLPASTPSRSRRRRAAGRDGRGALTERHRHDQQPAAGGALSRLAPALSVHAAPGGRQVLAPRTRRSGPTDGSRAPRLGPRPRRPPHPGGGVRMTGYLRHCIAGGHGRRGDRGGPVRTSRLPGPRSAEISVRGRTANDSGSATSGGRAG